MSEDLRYLWRFCSLLSHGCSVAIPLPLHGTLGLHRGPHFGQAMFMRTRPGIESSHNTLLKKNIICLLIVVLLDWCFGNLINAMCSWCHMSNAPSSHCAAMMTSAGRSCSCDLLESSHCKMIRVQCQTMMRILVFLGALPLSFGARCFASSFKEYLRPSLRKRLQITFSKPQILHCHALHNIINSQQLVSAMPRIRLCLPFSTRTICDYRCIPIFRWNVFVSISSIYLFSIVFQFDRFHIWALFQGRIVEPPFHA